MSDECTVRQSLGCDSIPYADNRTILFYKAVLIGKRLFFHNDFIDKVKSILNLHQKEFSEEKLQNIINHIFGMTCDRIQEGEIDFAMNHKKCIYCAADDFEDLMAEPEKIICVEMPNVTHHAWKTLDNAKKVQRIEKALMENKVI